MSSIGTKFILEQRFVFDPNNNSLVDQLSGDDVIRLGSNESRILLMLCDRPNQIISRDQLHEFVWRDQGFQVDDSSLTQAISTLRKLLQDSTKSPKFVKTVPKRGYQLICSIEHSIPLASGTEKPSKDKESTPSALSPEEKKLTQKTNQNPLSPLISHAFSTKLIIFIAVLLPLFVVLAIEPSPSKFRLVDTVNGIPVKTTEGHPPLDNWRPLLKSCITIYLQHNKEKPVEIIATAGPRNNLILNYVHSEENTIENETIQLFAEQQEMTKLCKQ